MGINALRLARVSLEDAHEHALRRETWGKKLIENQLLRVKFTEMALLIETCHSLMENVVQRSQVVSASDVELGTWAGILKVQAARTLEKVNREAQQVFGGLGYSRGGAGGRVEQISRDVRVIVVSGGSEEILLDMIIKLQRRLTAGRL
jgi:alkylation response protein AidB-like acyl-CoA dehydrogenase